MGFSIHINPPNFQKNPTALNTGGNWSNTVISDFTPISSPKQSCKKRGCKTTVGLPMEMNNDFESSPKKC